MSRSHGSTPRLMFPWEVAHACSAYRAMGLELELIELVCAQSIAEESGRPVASLDQAITEVLVDLAAVSEAPDEVVA